MPEKKIFLLDAYALIFRAYYAFISNPMRTSSGLNTSTMFGFTLTLDEVLRKENPSHIAVVFDPPGPTFRHEHYPQYKANREATPEDIKLAVPWLKRIIEAFNIPMIEVPGYEADDIIGTLAVQAEKQDFDVYMMTPDKDYAQLVSERIRMYKPGKGGNPPEILGVEEVCKLFSIENPLQVIDILALWGDAADNIPGVPGIGEKTAKSLISVYKSVETLLEHTDELKGKQKENLLASKDQLRNSKYLATIVTDAPVNFDFSQAERKPADSDKLRTLFNELEFKNLAGRILKEEPAPAAKKTPASASTSQPSLFDTVTENTPETTNLQDIHSTEHQYRLITREEELPALASELSLLKAFCFDTETTGLDPVSSEIVGLALSWEKGKAVYISFPPDKSDAERWLSVFKPVFAAETIEKIGQNIKFDLHILKNYNVLVKGRLFDTLIAAYLLHPEGRHNLNLLAEKYLAYRMVPIEELIGRKGANQQNFRNVAPEKAAEYAGEDADITWQISSILRESIDKQGINNLFDTIEMPLVPVLMEMEHGGIRIDEQALKIFAGELRADLIGLEEKIYSLAGESFNINSPKQLGDILFRKLKIGGGEKQTPTKQQSTSEEVLLDLLDKHEIVPEVLNYRSLKKLLSTYVEALPQLVNPLTGNIHTSFNQALVATGRLSSNNPNLQNIPVRDERGREIRKAFIPAEPGDFFLSADYSQIELRLMAHLSGDEGMIADFLAGEDIHTATAAKIFRTARDQVTREMRSRAKTANFGIIYGISAFGLAQRMRISRTEARELIDNYFATYKGVRDYMDQSIRSARERGYVETMFGRRRYLPDILSRNSVVRGNAERNAINAPIQGSAADIIKIAMVNIHEEMQRLGLKSRMTIQVHDELNFDAAAGELETLQNIVRVQMESAVKLSVPLIVDLGTGKNWLEAH
ncbi:MAG: DNA polymerase I [Bacteroidota bacterium]